MTPGRSLTTRSALGWAALAYAVFVIYASLLPFVWRPLAPGELVSALVRLFDWPTGRVSRTDVLANVLLFVPFGFALTGWLITRRAGAQFGVFWRVLTASVALSVVAELLQTLTAARVPSGVDIVAQTIGCSVGVALWRLLGHDVTTWVGHAVRAQPQDRAARLLVAYGWAWALVHLAPFDVTLDVGQIWDRLEGGQIGVVSTWWTTSTPRALWDTGIELLGAIPLGVMAMRRPHHSRVPPGLAFAGALVGVSGVEGAQAFLGSHEATLTDWAAAGVGAAVGVWAARRHWPTAADPAAVGARHRWSLRFLGTLLAWSMVVALYHWQPYDFQLNATAIREKAAGVSLLPYAGYARGSPLGAINDVLTKLGLAIPFGLLASFSWQWPGSRAVRWCFWGGVATVVFGLIESGQFLVPSRVPDPTDVLTALIGVAAGLALGDWLRPPHQGPGPTG